MLLRQPLHFRGKGPSNVWLFLLVALLAAGPGSSLALRAQQYGRLPGITLAYGYNLSGERWYTTPAGVIAAVDALGYPEAVQSDLRIMAEMWRDDVQGFTLNVSYEHPLPWPCLSLTAGGMFRKESARRYAEVTYDPTYIFSGTEMDGNGFGLDAGLRYTRVKGPWLAFVTVQAGYYFSARAFLHYFYLDPVVTGPPVERRCRLTEVYAGPGMRNTLGLGYQWHRLRLEVMVEMLTRGRGEKKAGGVGGGGGLRYALGRLDG
ncbi:MAG TPA: hypothetical protein P5550_01475 [Bacteroidales bacterium]|nr:hypothetical protein [Bacteroidales bacterium]